MTEALLEVPDRILFLLLDKYGRAIGHLGFANSINSELLMEVDNVIRGVPGQSPGLMTLALRTLLLWATDEFNPSGFYLQTFSDNVRAIDFYSKLGFKETERLGLYKVESANGYTYQPLRLDNQRIPEIYFIKMNLKVKGLIYS